MLTCLRVAAAVASGNRKEQAMVTLNVTLDVIALVAPVLLLSHKKK